MRRRRTTVPAKTKPDIPALTAEFDLQRGRVTLPRYPFPARKTRVLERGDIVEAVDWVVPVILTGEGELLCIHDNDREALLVFCSAQSVPLTKRHDVWADLLEPFLDTVHGDDWQVQTHQALRQAGFSDAEIVAIRARVAKRMEWLTMVTWEWQYYGLYDVLFAMKYPLPFFRRGWRKFYADAMGNRSAWNRGGTEVGELNGNSDRNRRFQQHLRTGMRLVLMGKPFKRTSHLR